MTRLFSELTAEEQVARDLSADLDDARQDSAAQSAGRAFSASLTADRFCVRGHMLLGAPDAVTGYCLGCGRWASLIATVDLPHALEALAVEQDQIAAWWDAQAVRTLGASDTCRQRAHDLRQHAGAARAQSRAA